jgi:hypothetical protein
MPDTRFTLLGKLCVWAVHATDTELRSALTAGGWKKVSSKISPYWRGGSTGQGKMNGRKKHYGTIKLKSKKKPTAKQIKARKLFAMRAKRGDFRR